MNNAPKFLMAGVLLLAASQFYSTVFGWDVETSSGGEYAYATLNGRPVASIVAYDEELGDAEGLWLPSISVTDVDQAMAAVKSGGGVDPDWGVDGPDAPVAAPLPEMGMPDMGGGMDMGGFDW